MKLASFSNSLPELTSPFSFFGFQDLQQTTIGFGSAGWGTGGRTEGEGADASSSSVMVREDVDQGLAPVQKKVPTQVSFDGRASVFKFLLI